MRWTEVPRPMAVILVSGCDVGALVVLIGRLGLLDSPVPVLLACGARSLVLSAIRILLAVGIFTSRRSRLVLTLAFSVVVDLAVLAQLLYAGYFHSVLVPKTLRHLGEVPSIASQVLRQIAGTAEVAVIVLFVIQGVALVRITRRPAPARLLSLLLTAALLTVMVTQGFAARWVYDRFSDIPSERLEVYGLPDAALRFGLVDLWRSQIVAEIRHARHPIPRTPDPGPIDADARPVEAGRPTGFNLILIQVESLDPWVIDAAVRDRAVMPFTSELARRSLVVPRMFAQHSGGGSSDAELSAFLSLLPLATHSGLLTARWDRVHPLPKSLEARGYTTMAFHSNQAAYFNRNLAYPNLGFQRLYAAGDFTGDARGWDARDQDFFAQALDVIEATPEPFLAALITMQSHGPFTNHRPIPRADPGPDRPQLLRDYLQCMAEVDEALRSFFRGLERLGLTDRSVIMLYGDHQSQVRPTDADEKERIPLVILAPGAEPRTIERVGSHLDLAPTAFHLLGLEAPSGWLGTSLLTPGDGLALFNDLRTIRFDNGRAQTARSQAHLPFLLYSAGRLDP